MCRVNVSEKYDSMKYLSGDEFKRRCENESTHDLEELRDHIVSGIRDIRRQIREKSANDRQWINRANGARSIMNAKLDIVISILRCRSREALNISAVNRANVAEEKLNKLKKMYRDEVGDARYLAEIPVLDSI